jgi:hypothetical protein
MSRMRTFALTAAAVLGLGLAQAGADDATAPVPAVGAVVNAAPAGGGQDKPATAAGLSAAAGVAMSVSDAAPVDGVSPAFRAAIESQAKPQGCDPDEICCYERHGQSCCCAPIAGCYCVPL